MNKNQNLQGWDKDEWTIWEWINGVPADRGGWEQWAGTLRPNPGYAGDGGGSYSQVTGKKTCGKNSVGIATIVIVLMIYLTIIMMTKRKENYVKDY